MRGRKMSNIEVVGVYQGGPDYDIIRKIVAKHLNPEDLESVVFTLHQATVEDPKGCNAPYVRIADTDLERAERVAEQLSNLYDVEILILAKFIPKKNSAGHDETPLSFLKK